jgi:hypothetical protein
MVTARRVGALVGFLAAVGAVSAGRLCAHPLHSSYAEITREPAGAVVMQVRLFADDFGALLDSLRASSGAPSQEVVARQYVQRQLILTAADGAPIPTDWCGMRSRQNVIWVCVRTAKPIGGPFRVRNALMFDRFTDQISIIRWTGRKETRTLVLSARVPDARLE